MAIAQDLSHRIRAAVALQRDGKLHEALDTYRAIMDEAPRFPDAFHFGGLSAHALGNHEQARAWLLAAERLAPDNAFFLLNESRFFTEMGEPEEAERRAARARKLMPNHPQALIQHAITLIALDRGDELIQKLEALAKLHPKDTSVAILLARCQLQGGFRDQARSTFVRACEQSDSAVAHLEFGEFLRDEGLPETSRAHYERVTATGSAPQQAIAHCGLAAAAAQLGDRALACRHAEQALTLDKQCHLAWRYYVEASTDGGLAAIKPRLEQARATAAEPDDLVLDFVLGSLLERQRDYPGAWGSYCQGNAKRHHGLQGNGEQINHFFEGVRRNLDASFLDRHAALGSTTELPIFIVGMPRSGTTLVERALGGHSAVREGGELKVLPDILKRRAGAQHRDDLPRWLGTCSSRELGALAQEWQGAMENLAQGSPRLTDKLPSNFAWFGLISVCFPNATIIHVRRDPRDVFVSCWATLFDASMTYCYDVDTFREYYRCYRSAMQNWGEVCHHKRYIEIDYEALTENFDDIITKVLQVAGLNWEPGCREFADRGGNVSTSSLFQVRRPLNRRSVGRWKHFRDQLGPLADLQAWRTDTGT